MAKFSTQWIRLAEPEELNFKYDVYINKEGIFTTTLPEEMVRLFEDGGIKFDSNRMGRSGFFQAKTFDELVKIVKEVSKEYVSRELKEEKIIIRYIIQTTCLYCLDIKGNVVPNGQVEWMEKDEHEWKEGTVSQYDNLSHPYGFQVFVKPCFKRTYLYRSGKEIVEYDRFNMENRQAGFFENKYNLKWLYDLTAMAKPHVDEEINEMDYTEEAAKFFVDIIKGICTLNERIKDLLKPEALESLISKGIKLLT